MSSCHPSRTITPPVYPNLTQAGLEDPGVDPVFAAADDVTICLTPSSWRSWELKSVDDQYFGGVLRQTPQKWFLPLG